MNTNKRLNKMIKISVLAAIAAILMFFEFPIIPLFSWLKLDFSELPVLMGAFAFGPIAGIVIEGIKILINFLLTGSGTGGVGELANFIIGISFVVPASMIYHKNKSRKSAIIGMIVGTVIVNIVGILANIYVLLPLYGMPMSGSAALKYITLGLIPLNTIKAVSISILTYLLYKRLSVSIFKADDNLSKKKTSHNRV